ncbi:hypothetical protein SAMN05216597_3710 [Pseudomonas cannabina]|nr:hypothetical protein SAMN05216597_3710 [Pseudomonas cannabina]
MNLIQSADKTVTHKNLCKYWDTMAPATAILATREALIYSIFRPCNALEALIYLGATAGF